MRLTARQPRRSRRGGRRGGQRHPGGRGGRRAAARDGGRRRLPRAPGRPGRPPRGLPGRRRARRGAPAGARPGPRLRRRPAGLRICGAPSWAAHAAATRAARRGLTPAWPGQVTLRLQLWRSAADWGAAVAEWVAAPILSLDVPAMEACVARYEALLAALEAGLPPNQAPARTWLSRACAHPHYPETGHPTGGQEACMTRAAGRRSPRTCAGASTPCGRVCRCSSPCTTPRCGSATGRACRPSWATSSRARRCPTATCSPWG